MARISALILAFWLSFTLVSAQPYRCDWSVNGIGGGEMSGGDFRSSVTAGQTAIGRLTGTNLLALIGFWQADVAVGIAEEQEPNLPWGLETGLERTIPNPSRMPLRISYSLSEKSLVRMELFDLSGRLVSTLVNSFQNPGRYSLVFNGSDARGRRVPTGVYFLRFTAGDYQHRTKLILQ